MTDWLRHKLFSSWASALVTLLIVVLAGKVLSGFVQWSVTQAVFVADAGLCRALDGTGACWGLIAEKWRLILFGRYPHAEQWRPAPVSYTHLDVYKRQAFLVDHAVQRVLPFTGFLRIGVVDCRRLGAIG